MLNQHMCVASKTDRVSRMIPNVSRMMAAIGRRVRKLRGDRSQDWLESASGVGRSIISQIELAGRDYQTSSLLRLMVALREDQDLLETAANPAHQELHRKLQELLDAGGEWETTAVTLTGAVYDRFQKKSA